MKIAIIGGGAAGFFSAIHAKRNYPEAEVVIYEKSKKVLSKVKISGGGRCNVTNNCPSLSDLANAYPRGGKKLKKAFRVFSNKDMMAWLEEKGINLVVEEGSHVFPATQTSQTIIDCFLGETRRLGIKVFTGMGVKSILACNERLQVHFIDEKNSSQSFDKVIVATGGSPKRRGLEWLEALNHKIEDPVPSLFTFNMPNECITDLMGIVVEPATASIQGTKLKATGPLLITHWGMSGPAILKLSAWGARLLSDMNYEFKVQVNWVNEPNNELVRAALQRIIKANSKKLLSNYRPYSLPDRLWQYLLQKMEMQPERRWGELGKKGLNKLINTLTNDIYAVKGKTTFKEEFVTCGGVSLDSIDFKTMQSKVCKNLYFAGEVLDIDGITGGYNFQSAWTTAYIAAALD